MGVDADYIAGLKAVWETPARAFAPYSRTGLRLMVALMGERLGEVESDLELDREDLLVDSLAGLSAMAELLAQARGLDLDAERRRQLGERRSLLRGSGQRGEAG